MHAHELDAPAAYEAARDRALRTTEALILAEGQVRQLTARLAEVTTERDRYATEAGKAAAARARRRVRDRARRERSAEGCGLDNLTEEQARDRGLIPPLGEGVDDAAEDADPIGYTGAVGQAD